MKPQLQKQHLQAWPKFADDHMDKEKVFWSDETKMELFGHNDHGYVCRNKGEAISSKNTITTVQHSGGSIMFQGCFAAIETVELHNVDRIMQTEEYLTIQHNLKPSAR